MVSRLVLVRTELAKLKAEDRELTQVLVDKAGPGLLHGVDGEPAQVIFPAAKIVFEPDKVPEIRDRTGGVNFKKLSVCEIVYKPVKNCRDVAIAILSKVQLREFLALTEKESSPYVRIPDL